MGQGVGGLVLGIGGRLIGGFLGGPVGALVGGLAGGLIGSMLGGRSAKPLIQDFQLANSSFGRPIPLIYGQWRTAGTVIWESKIVSHTQGGLFGKGLGGGGGSTATIKYTQSAAFAFVQGPARILKVWLDGKLFIDFTSTAPTELGAAKFVGRVYTGTEDQLPDPLIQEWVIENVDPPLACPAYRGLAYFVAENVLLNDFGGRMPNITAAWATDVTDRVIYQQMRPLANDPAFSAATTTPITLKLSTDWTSGRIYVLNTQDNSVRMFDIRTGQCLLYRTWDQIWAPAPAPSNRFSFAGNAGITATIAAAPGGGVYIAAGDNLVDYVPTIWTLNPDTLQATNTVTTPPNSPDAEPLNLVPFQLVSPLGVDDMLAKYNAQWQSVMVVNPATGFCSAWLPVAWAGLNGHTCVVVGKRDTLLGTVDLWLVSSSAFDGGLGTMYIYKVIVDGSDPGGLALGTPSILTAPDFGISPGPMVYLDPTVAYDASDDTLIISNPVTTSASIKWSPTLGVVWATQPAIIPDAQPQSAQWLLSSGVIGTGLLGTFSVYSTSTGAQDWTVSGEPVLQVPGTISSYDSQMNALSYTDPVSGSSVSTIWVAYLQRVVASEVLVAHILRDLCERAGIASDAIDVSLVWQTTVGYALTEEKAFGSAIADLCQIFQIDMVESDYKLKFIPRGSPAVATITQDHLASIDSDPSHYWEAKRAIEQEMPLQINVRYYDVGIDYQTGASYAKRTALPVPTVYSKRVKTVDLPLVATNERAHQIAESWLYTMWAERETYRTKLGPEFLWLDPTDNVVVSLDNGEALTVRFEKTEIGEDFTITVDAASEDIDTYNPSLAGGADISQGVQTVQQSPNMALLQFNIPLLADGDDLGGTASRIYYAAGPTGTATPTDSAVLYESTDSGISFAAFNTVSIFAGWGFAHAASALADTSSIFATDFTNTLTVIPSAGSTIPTSITYTDMMNGQNVAIVGSEIIQFQNVTINADGSVTLSTLLRGRRGTDWAVGTHVGGELFAFVEAGDMIGGILPLSQIGQGELWKLVPLGRFLDSTAAKSFTYRGYDLLPYAPVHFARTAVGSPPDLVLTWKRRSRLGGGDGLVLDGSDTVPLGESSESYAIYLLANASSIDTFDPTNSATYVRSFPQSPTATPRITLNAPTVTYTAAMMATDGFDPVAGTLYVVGYQLSALVGRGFRGYEVLAAPVIIGSAVIGPPALITLSPGAIASSEAIGTVALSGGVSGPTITLAPRTIASTEGETEPTLSGSGVIVPTTTLRPATVASSETEGFPVVAVAGGTTGGGGGFHAPMQNRSLYYLGSVDPASVTPVATDFNVVVVDPTADGGSGDTFWTAAQVAAMRNPGGGLVLAYFDMGGAESFRDYYAQAKAAGILSTTVNSWGENSVMYWSSTWQSIAQAWAAKAIAAGFDGIYLDVADCYTDPWCIQRAPAGGGYPAGSQAAAGWQEIQFMATLKAWCQTQKPGFQLWENAGEGLSDTTQFGSTPRFVDVIDGALREQVIYSYPGNGNTPASGTVPINTDLSGDFANLARIIAAGKPVTLTEYVGSGGNAIGGGTVTNAGVASLNGTVVGSGVTNAIHWVRRVCAAWNCGYYISVADYNVSNGPTLSVVDTEGITTP